MKQTFHGFDIREKIGAGGMSTVYRGEHQTLGYPVAVKVLHPALAGDESFIARFEREARSASSLRSNNIATVIDFGTENDIYFIVMEFIDGPDLSQLIVRLNEGREHPVGIPAEIALILLEEAAYGLQEAHAQNIIHRDVKPSNVLINTKGEVKLADFGLARDTSKVSPMGQQDLTMPGMVVGTPSYMSPEQAVGNESIDHRTDIFSLGVVAYLLLSGRKPFTGTQPAEVQENIINLPPPPVDAHECPLLTPEIEQLLAKMLAKDPSRRYQSMEQVRRGVQSAIDSIDLAGNIGRHRREYLRRFVADPRAFAEEMRQQNIADRLKRGYHYKEMGLSNIDDAVLEFNVVLALDPENPKAAAALVELQRKAEESGVAFPAAALAALAADPDVTRVLQAEAAAAEAEAPDPADRTRVVDRRAGDETSAPPRGAAAAAPWWRRPLPLGGAAVAAVAIVAILVGVLGGDDTPPDAPPTTDAPTREAPASTVPTTTADRPVGSPAGPGDDALAAAEATDGDAPGGEDVAGDDDATGDPNEAATQAAADAATPATPATELPAPAAGMLALTSEPPAAEVYVRRPGGGAFDRRGLTPWEAELPAGRWEIRLQKDEHVGRSYVLEVPADGRKEFAATLAPVPRGPGWIKVVAVPYADMYVDGELQESSTKLAFLEVAGGRDVRVELRHPEIFGYHRLDGLNVAPGETLQVPPHRFRITSLSVGARPWGRVVLDGRTLAGETPLKLDLVAAGEHRISVVRDGFRATGAWLRTDTGRQPLERLADANGRPVYRLDLDPDRAASILFELSPEP